jgi:hypothetical protein
MRTRAVLSHTAQAVAEGALIALLVVGLAAGTTFAAKGGGGGGKHGGGGGSTTGGSATATVVMVTDLNGNGAPNWGDTIRFNVTTTVTEPNVNLYCYQNGSLVYGATTGYYASYPWPWTQNMTLSSPTWVGGAASCTATISYYSGSTSTTIGSTSFSVGS